MIWVLLLTGAVSMSSESLSKADVEIANQSIVGCLDNMSRLRSGECRVTGSISGQVGAGMSSRIDVYTAFDLNAQRIRFDDLTPDQGGLLMGGRYIRDGQRSFVSAGETPRAIVQSLASSPPHAAIEVFDIRSIGLFSMRSYVSISSHEEFFENLAAKDLTVVERQGSLVKLRFDDKAGFFTELWLDAKKGFSWVKYRVSSSAQPIDIDIDIETSWGDFNNVWAPVSVRISDKQGVGTQEVHLSVEWEKVNEMIAAALFEPESLASKESVGLYSNELGGALLFLRTINDTRQ